MERTIANIISKKYVHRINKYVVELGFFDGPKQTVWLSEKQMINLQNCFEELPKEHSNKSISVIGIWNDKGYFYYAKVSRHKEPRRFTLPQQYNLTDLRDD